MQMIVGIFVNFQKEHSSEILENIVSIFNYNRVNWLLINEENKKAKNFDLLITIGGDGTLLNVVEKASIEATPVLAINCGRLGYLTEEVEEDIEKVIFKLLKKEYFIEERHIVEAVVKEKVFFALNDVCVVRNTFNIVDLCLYIDGVFAQEYRSDGIIVATATGSTAYSLSAGGPIVEPQLGVILVTPICPHSLSSRSLILGSTRTIKVENSSSENVQVVVDGRLVDELAPEEFIECKISQHKLKLIRLKQRNFYEILREKIKE